MMLRSVWAPILVCFLALLGFGAGAGFEDEFTIKSATQAIAPGGRSPSTDDDRWDDIEVGKEAAQVFQMRWQRDGHRYSPGGL